MTLDAPPIRPRVLVVEDSLLQARMVVAKLRMGCCRDNAVVHAATLAEAVQELDRAEADPFDCVLLDLGLPDADGLEALTRVRTTAPGTAVVVLSGEEDDQVALLAVREGAQDYLVKGESDDHLERAISHAIERKRQEAQLLHQALHDGLTGLANRTQFASRLELAITRLHRHPQPVALLFLDLDGFKAVNDHLGHDTGDQVLIAVARRLQSIARNDDLVARLGGDEFVILAEDTDVEAAQAISQRARAAIAEPIETGAEPVVVGVSIGIAAAHGSGASPDHLLHDADAAMYREKSLSSASGGRSRRPAGSGGRARDGYEPVVSQAQSSSAAKRL